MFKVTIFGTRTDLFFASERAATDEFLDRYARGQKAYLWAWRDAAEGEHAGFDIVRSWHDVEREEDEKRFAQTDGRDYDVDEERDRAELAS